MSSILVTGSKGQLGSDIQQLAFKFPEYSFLFTDVDELDITDLQELNVFFNKNYFDVVINCVAYTAVDKSENDRDLAYELNAKAPGYLAEMCRTHGAMLIHISSDYVFDGSSSRPYIEEDSTVPIGYYGRTKLDGELEIIAKEYDSVIIRTSWLYSTFGSNFVKTILRVAKEKESMNVVFDQVGTPTYAGDLALAILTIIPKLLENKGSQCTEIYHYSNEGVTSWYDFAREIVELAGLSCKINPIETKDYPTPTRRPHYSVFNKSKIKTQFNLTIPNWKESLKKVIAQLTKIPS